jgi:hypothetical protein
MRIAVYKDGRLVAKATADRLDVCAKSLMIFNMKIKEEIARDYFYFPYEGEITFVLHVDELRIDLFEPHESGEGHHHIRLVAYDW